MAAMPANSAAAPEAQAFSQRVAGLKRRSGDAWCTSDDAKPSGTMPELKCPRYTASISAAPICASAKASRVAATMRSSRLSASSRPNLVWPLPTMDTVCGDMISPCVCYFYLRRLGYVCLCVQPRTYIRSLGKTMPSQNLEELAFRESPAPQIITERRHILRCNQAFAALFGHEVEELEGELILKLYPSSADYYEIGDRCLRALRDKTTYEDERFMQHRDRQIFWARARGATLTPTQPSGLT